ncbi:MAG: hypothetical protein LBR99_04970 [Treponema sp.]|nr:hypothetical protein [Treponema sp.]
MKNYVFAVSRGKHAADRQGPLSLKRLWVVLFFCAGSLLSAQELSDITLYFTPAIGGSPKEREFFDANLPREIRSRHYKVVESPDEADFLVSVAIAENEDSGYTSYIILGLTMAADGSPLIEISYNYVDVEEMYTWNIGAILAPENLYTSLPSEINIKRQEQL